MKRTKQSEPNTLTEEETAFLRSDRSPELIKQFVARQHETVGVRTEAYRKVAAAARAEADALMAVATLVVARKMAGADDGRLEDSARRQLEIENRTLTAALSMVRSQLEQVTASSALAVHSEPTSR